MKITDDMNDVMQKAIRRADYLKEQKRLTEERIAKACGNPLPSEKKTEQPQYDSIYALENGEATILYIIVMAVGTLFNARILIYIVATAIWLKYIRRHKK